MTQLLYGEHVKQAQQNGTPIVALETTVITHGMNFPDNLEIAQKMEQAVRDAGACPATLGIIAGKLVVGMSEDEIIRFAKTPRGTIQKASARDFPYLLGKKLDGSLTVAGTMMVAKFAQIDIFATGGIGGVHRGAPFDVSADLMELGKTPVCVVCAGAKSILDLPLTLEVLETQGVPIVGYQCENLPSFYSRDSGLALPASAKDPIEAAEILKAWRGLKRQNGLLFTAPVPHEAEMPHAEIEDIIKKAVQLAEEANIIGAKVTPFLLENIAKMSDGRSLAANKALLVNNAKIAGEIAVCAK